jgi:adenosyl cobinamide kinase/adenosyl cobinamide phosphate guanylyltransferase
MLERNHQDWEETAYQLLAQNFGFKINAEPMLRLAQGLPLKILQKHRDNLTQMEALLLGQSGMLPAIENADKYVDILRREYDFLSAKYSLKSQQLRAHEWKFLRLRPANFPTVRLAQLATLVQRQPSLFSLFIHAETLKMLQNALRVEQSGYWQKHYQFQKEATGKVPALGKTSVENIIVNTVVPLLVAYSEAKDSRLFLDKALELLEQLPAEQNHITEMWEGLELKTKTAFDSQGVIELYNNFCSEKRCLNCGIGTALLKS